MPGEDLNRSRRQRGHHAESVLPVTGLGSDEDVTGDAWRRVFAFFDQHLKTSPPQ
jgi:hypothetical protein